MNFKWDSYLSSGEKVEVDFGVSNNYSACTLGLTTAVGIAMGLTNQFVGIGVFLLGFIYWYYLTRGKRYAFTSKRVILVDSFLGKNVINIKYENITDITVDQNFVDLICGWGNIIINTAGSTFSEAILQNVNDPQKLKNKLDDLSDASKK